MTGDSLILKGFTARLKTTPGINVARIAFPNVVFDSEGVPENEFWFRPTLLSSRPTQSGLGLGSRNRHLGIYQIDIFAPANNGLYDSNLWAEAFEIRFGRGTKIEVDGETISCQRAYRKERGSDEATKRFVLSVLVDYQADLPNP